MVLRIIKFVTLEEFPVSKTIRFGVAMPEDLLNKFDALILRKNYPNRSKAIGDLARNRLIEEEWKLENKETVGTITVVYNHRVKEITEILTDLQHRHCKEIISCLHVHLDKENCLEVLILKGKAKKLKEISERLIATKGVKHAKLVPTTTGKQL
jgi:CopG family nickel-responsive transcriptional regulator